MNDNIIKISCSEVYNGYAMDVDCIGWIVVDFPDCRNDFYRISDNEWELEDWDGNGYVVNGDGVIVRYLLA